MNREIQNKLAGKLTVQEEEYIKFSDLMNISSRDEFAIDLDDIWEKLGFKYKATAKKMLVSDFIENRDYTISLPSMKEEGKRTRGYNKQTIMLTRETFQKIWINSDKFCLKEEEINAHQMRYRIDNYMISTLLTELREKKCMPSIEDTLLPHFPEYTQCVYYGTIDNLSSSGESLIKFGRTDKGLKSRIEKHKHTYSNFKLINAFAVDNSTQIEHEIRTHYRKYQRTSTVKKLHRELLVLGPGDFTELNLFICERIIANKKLK